MKYIYSNNGKHYYHTLECLFCGLSKWTNVAEHLELALDKLYWPRLRFIVDDPKNIRGTIAHKIIEALFPVDDRVTFAEWLAVNDSSRQAHREAYEKVADGYLCGSCDMSTSSVTWLREFIRKKHGFEELSSDEVCQAAQLPSEKERDQAMLRALRVLILNRRGKRYWPAKSTKMMEQRVFASSNVTSVHEVPQSLPDQMRLFSSHHVIITPHGAAEANLLAARETQPTLVIEVCSPYIHCDCIRLCPSFYEDRFGLLFLPLAFELSDVDCHMWCTVNDTQPSSERIEVVDMRSMYRDIKNLPDFKHDAIQRIVSQLILPVFKEYCGRIHLNGKKKPVRMRDIGEEMFGVRKLTVQKIDYMPRRFIRDTLSCREYWQLTELSSHMKAAIPKQKMTWWRQWREWFLCMW